MTRRWGHQPNAADIPYDPNVCSSPFTADNVQDAICEARLSATGKLMPFFFFSTGNVSNKWLNFTNGSTTSDTLPMVLQFGANLIGTTFSNQDNNVDMDIEIYRNGVLPANLMYTRLIRNKRTAWKTDISISGFNQGDRISVYFKKFTGGTGISTAQNPVVQLLFAVNPAQLGDGGQQNGD